MVEFAAWAYLKERGYTVELAREEGVKLFPKGKHSFEGFEFGCVDSSFVFPCRTMSGAFQGLLLTSWGEQEKRYEWRPSKFRWLPICYAQPDDWVRLYETGELFLVEGVFDRIALKRCFPDRAVIARLSKSVASIQWILKRYATRIWLGFDRDEEGQKGAARLRYRLRESEIDVSPLTFMGKDPGDHFVQHGLTHLRDFIDRQMEETL